MKIFPRVLIAILSVLFLFSCVKDELIIDDIDYGIRPEFGLPIANLTLLASRLIDNYSETGTIDVAENGSISLIYRDTLNPLRAADLLDLKNLEYIDTLEFSPGEYDELIGNGSVTVNNTSIYSFESNAGDRLDSVRFSQGTLTLNVHSQGSFTVSGFIKILNADNTEAVSLDFLDAVPPISIQDQVSFEDLKLLFQNTDHVSNGLSIQYQLTFTNQGVTNSHPTFIGLSFRDFTIKTAGGYIAPRQIEFNDQTVNLEIFDDPSAINVRIEDPRLNFNFENGFGMSLGIAMNNVIGESPTGETMVVDGSSINQLPPIAASQQDGVPAFSTLTINNDLMTPTVTDLLSFGPNKIKGDFGLLINPENQENVFISHDNELKMNIEVVMPLYGSIADFLLIDTTALDLGNLIKDVEDIAGVEALNIRLIVKNGFPFDAGVQIIFTDSLLNPIDALFEQPELIYAAAPVNLAVPVGSPEYGRAVGMTQTITDIHIPKSRILELENATKMIITVFGNTAGNGDHPIRLFSNDAFDVKLGAKVKLNLNTDR